MDKCRNLPERRMEVLLGLVADCCGQEPKDRPNPSR